MLWHPRSHIVHFITNYQPTIFGCTVLGDCSVTVPRSRHQVSFAVQEVCPRDHIVPILRLRALVDSHAGSRARLHPDYL